MLDRGSVAATKVQPDRETDSRWNTMQTDMYMW